MSQFIQDVMLKMRKFLSGHNDYKKVDKTDESDELDKLNELDELDKLNELDVFEQFVDLEKGINLVSSTLCLKQKCCPINLCEITNTPIGLFKIGFSLLDAKITFLLVVLLSESIGLITTWALITKRFWLVILSPILSIVIRHFVQDYYIQLRFAIMDKWKNIVYAYFNELSYPSRKKTDMHDYKNQVERTGYALINIINWAFPSMIKLGFIFTSCLLTFYFQGKAYFIAMFPVLIGLYYWFRMRFKQEELTLFRKIKKDIEKKIRPSESWILHLFQNRKRKVNETLEISSPITEAELKYIRGWESISNELCMFAELISGISLYWVSVSFSDLLINKVVFNQLTNSIENIGHITNAIANNLKDFDRFIDWVKSSDVKPMEEQYQINFPLEITTSIKLGDPKKGEFKLKAKHLSIGEHDKILLRGESGIGKTQLVNSLQGLIPGTLFGSKHDSEPNYEPNYEQDYDFVSPDDLTKLTLMESVSKPVNLPNLVNLPNPENYESKWEYMNQQTRETIPSSGLTIRQMLEDESDDDLILKLIQMVQLESKFNSDNFDIPMESLSGGERMRLSILYTLWDMNKRNKQILILDEPEQGLDEDIRVQVIKNIIEKIDMPILVIYHGSKLDLLQLSFTKVWIFESTISEERQTFVTEKPFWEFKNEISKEIKKLLV
jgi:energy-coupling factor transporter ATP-binding protein EcfA2